LITKATTVADEYAQSENLRDSAIQEAAYLRARMAILEGDNSSSNEEPSHERVREMEDYLAETERTKKALETRTSELTSEIDRLSSQIDTLNVADADAMKRADKAEEAEYKIRSELHAAQDRLALLDTELREHASRIVALSSNVQQRETELQEHKTNLKKLENDHDDRLHDMEKLQAALQSAEQRAQTASESLASLQIRVEEVERELGDARVEVLKRSQEAEQSAKRIAIIEPELKSLESKLHTYRELADGRLGQVATSRNGGTQVESFAGLPDKMSPIAQECASLRKMLNEAGLQIESAQSNLMTQRTAIEEHTKQNLELQSELRQAQARSAKDAAIVAAMTTTLAVREDQHRRHGEAIMELQARCAMMRNLLADHNIAIHDVPEAANALKHSADNDYRRELEEARSELAQLRQHVQNTQARAIVPDGEKAKAIDSEDARVAVLETRLVESEAAHKKKLSQVETDYQTAVRYVK
jgi:chromosome segregation ATPase